MWSKSLGARWSSKVRDQARPNSSRKTWKTSTAAQGAGNDQEYFDDFGPPAPLPSPKKSVKDF